MDRNLTGSIAQVILLPILYSLLMLQTLIRHYDACVIPISFSLLTVHPDMNSGEIHLPVAY